MRAKGLKEACCRAQRTLLLHKAVPAAAVHGTDFAISEEDWMGQQQSTVPVQASWGLP